MISPLGFLSLLQLPGCDMSIRRKGRCRATLAQRIGRVSAQNIPQEVPETRLGDDLVGRKDAHAVDLGGGLMLRGQVTADDLVFVERHLAVGGRV